MSVAIDWDDRTSEWHLRNDAVSYLLRVLGDGSLGALYFGSALTPGTSYGHLARGAASGGFQDRLGEPLGLEYPTQGTGDFRVPALTVEHEDGSRVVGLAYLGHTIEPGKPDLPGLPSTYAEHPDEAATLAIVLVDAIGGTEALLRYTIFRDVPVVARSVRLTNRGEQRLRVRCAMSASLDLPDAAWEMVQLSGAWSRERHVHTTRLAPGRRSISSVRGASGHEHDPSLLLKRPSTTEETGEAYGFSLVYSGDFLAEAEVEPFGTTRVRLGIDPERFGWTLDPGSSFEVPEAVLVHSRAGVGGVSDAFHRLYRERLARGSWRDRPRPVLINNWEGTYFAFTEEKLLQMASVARGMGIELFVLDDGWFGRRDDDTSSLGDWFVDRRKLPNGIDGLARSIEALGMSFGLWIEPEMVSERSALYAEHPDWAVGIPGRPRTTGRNQLVLDMGRPEVVDHLFGMLSEVFASAPISYVKWDMNRYITEPYSLVLPPDRQTEFAHRYILGVYDLYARLNAAFPAILFESCAGGGGRLDPGILAYAPQGWTSDDTDAVERLAIQWGTSVVYPLSSMGAHVSAVPNHQVGRITPLSTRAAVAFFGVFGYELDPTVMPADERAEVAQQVAFYKRHRELFQRGRFMRLRGPFDGDGNDTAWMVVAGDRATAVVGVYRVLNRDPFHGSQRSGMRLVTRVDRLRLRGLDPDVSYRVTTWPTEAGSVVRGGDELIDAGLVLDTHHDDTDRKRDFWARLFVLEADPTAGRRGSRRDG